MRLPPPRRAPGLAALSLAAPRLLGDGGGGDHQMSEYCGVLGRGGAQAAEAVAPLGDDEHVRGGHRADVAEGEAHLVRGGQGLSTAACGSDQCTCWSPAGGWVVRAEPTRPWPAEY